MNQAVSQAVLAHIAEGLTAMPELAAAFNGENKRINNAIQKLQKRGFIKLLNRGLYELTPAGREHLESGAVIQGGQATPRPRARTRGLRQRAWWVLRARQAVTVAELMGTLADGSQKDAHSNLSRYLRALELSGFVRASGPRVAGASVHSNGHKRYVLVRNTGRQAPVVRAREGKVFDPNTLKVHPLSSTEDKGDGHD